MVLPFQARWFFENIPYVAGFFREELRNNPNNLSHNIQANNNKRYNYRP